MRRAQAGSGAGQPAAPAGTEGVRFAGFELDPRSGGELWHNGTRQTLAEQPRRLISQQLRTTSGTTSRSEVVLSFNDISRERKVIDSRSLANAKHAITACDARGCVGLRHGKPAAQSAAHECGSDPDTAQTMASDPARRARDVPSREIAGSLTSWFACDRVFFGSPIHDGCAAR